MCSVSVCVNVNVCATCFLSDPPWHHMYEGRQHRTPLLERTCVFCSSNCNNMVVEDTYHVLSNALSMAFYMHVCTHNCTKMVLTSRQYMTLIVCMYKCVLCVCEAKHVRAVGRFHADCLHGCSRCVFSTPPVAVLGNCQVSLSFFLTANFNSCVTRCV